MKDKVARVVLAVVGIAVIAFLFWLANCGVLRVR